MKKITLALLLMVSCFAVSYSQVTIGNGNNQERATPFDPYWGYSYTQSIYLASEINASGSISSIQWYFSGSSDLSASQDLVIYFGLTNKSAFVNAADFIADSDLTQVYAGGITTASTSGWVTITLPTPFAYDGTSNLVIAVDENNPAFDTFTDDFYNTDVASNRSIFANSDEININPNLPAINQDGSVVYGTTSFVPNIILGGISQACPNIDSISISNITTTSATASWTAPAGQTNWNVIVQPSNLPAPTQSSVGISVTTPNFAVTGLDINTSYCFYVQSVCDEDVQSAWSNSSCFSTLCDSTADFFEQFTDISYGAIPNCWSRLVTSTDSYAHVLTNDFSGVDDSGCASLYNGDDANAQLLLISPSLTNLNSNSHRIKFKAKAYDAHPLVLGTMTNPADATTFTAVETFTLSGDYTVYSHTFTNTGSANFIAFKHGGGCGYRTLFIDDIAWEFVPTETPTCATDLMVTTNPECGNDVNLFTWSSVAGADGYRFSIGTLPNGGGLLVDDVNINSSLSYAFTGEANSTYYYKLTPYNALGDATSCPELSFETYGEGCYCTSEPLSVDGQGITEITVGVAEFQNLPVTYTDFTEDSSSEIIRGENSPISITFETGYAYKTNVWIDFNDDYTFDPSELVYTGTSLMADVFVLSGEFMIPADANLGVHRMRISAADSGQTPADPCFNGMYGVTVDLNVDIVEDLGSADFDYNSITAYPNPVKDILTVSYSQKMDTIEVYNLVGQLVKSIKASSEEVKINLSDLSSGAYLVRISSDSTFKTFKIIKR